MKIPKRRRNHEYYEMIRLCREQSADKTVTMRQVAEFAIGMGWHPSPPKSATDRLAEQFSRVARTETRIDKRTKLPYRVNQSYNGYRDGAQTMLWFDIDDDAPRGKMLASLTLRRQDMVDDGYRLTLDADHWNADHLNEKPIQLVLDFRKDIEERKNAPNDEEDAG